MSTSTTANTLPPPSQLPTLPPIQLSHILSLLLSASPVSLERLVPPLRQRFSVRPETAPRSYAALIDACEDEVGRWADEERAEFVSGHPRIGERAPEALKGMSAAEQKGNASDEVLTRFEQLNASYERVYPSLRYITFVNGRSRAELVPEFEAVVAEGRRLASGGSSTENENENEVGSTAWKRELDRDAREVWKIARARLGRLGVE